ncbi:hypothetical protein QQ045_017673 [Rhodiola kirilowii]
MDFISINGDQRRLHSTIKKKKQNVSSDWTVRLTRSTWSRSDCSFKLGEAPTPLLASSSTTMRPAFAFHAAAMDMFHNHLSPPPKLGLISIRAKIVRTEGVKALFSGVSATILRQMLYSTICMGLYDLFKHKWSDPDFRHDHFRYILFENRRLYFGLSSIDVEDDPECEQLSSTKFYSFNLIELSLISYNSSCHL